MKKIMLIALLIPASSLLGSNNSQKTNVLNNEQQKRAEIISNGFFWAMIALQINSERLETDDDKQELLDLQTLILRCTLKSTPKANVDDKCNKKNIEQLINNFINKNCSEKSKS